MLVDLEERVTAARHSGGILTGDDKRERQVTQEGWQHQFDILLKNVFVIRIKMMVHISEVKVAIVALDAFQSAEKLEGTLSKSLW